DPALWARGYDWYLNEVVDRRPGATVTFDADPSYAAHPDSWRRMLAADPTARVVVVLRHPVERAFSHYLFRLANGWRLPGFEAVLAEEERLRREGTADPEIHCYLSRSHYAPLLQALRHEIPAAQLKVILFDDLVADQGAVARDLHAWLGLRQVAAAALHANPTTGTRISL